MSRKGESVTLSLSTEQKERLEQIALDFGQTWGEKPNISQLLRAIADGKLKVVWSDQESTITDQRNAMKLAIAMIQEGLSKLLKIL